MRVLRHGHGSLKVNCNLNNKNRRGSVDSNLDGGFRDNKPQTTPEISVIAIDVRRYSEDLKKDFSKSNNLKDGKDLKKDIDADVISNYIGHTGRWQFIWTFLLSLFQIPPSLHLFSFVFQTIDKDFWCARPDHMASMNVSIWKNLTQPENVCNVLDVNWTNIHGDFHYTDSNNFFKYLQTPLDSLNYTDCTSFEYSTDDGSYTSLVEEFNLVCSRSKMLSLIEMCYLAGAGVGGVSSGWISDRFGRKHTLLAFALVQTIFGTILAFCTSLTMFMTLRVIMGFASVTVAVVGFVLVVELVSGKWRTIIGILSFLPATFGYVSMAGIAYFIRDWRTLQLVISLPMLTLLCLWYYIPESPRWLLANGRLPQLYAIVERAARMNHRTLPSNYQKSLEAAAPPLKRSTERTENGLPIEANNKAEPTQSLEDPAATTIDAHSNPLLVVFGKRYGRTTCLTLVVWLALIIVYFGLTLHLNNLGGNVYLNTAVAGIAEMFSISVSIFVVLKLGIRRNAIAFTLISGIFCLATNIVPNGENGKLWVISLAMIAKCVIGANNPIMSTYTAGQYPTVVRNFGLGIANLSAGVGLILVPYLWLLEHIDPLLPMTVMGISGIIGAIAIYMMKDIEEE